MKIKCVWEHHGDSTLLHAVDFPGAFTRGESKEAALRKMPGEILAYGAWRGLEIPEPVTVEIIQEKSSDLQICDADSDVIFDTEKTPLSMEEYLTLKALSLKSASDFLELYNAVPDPDKSCLEERTTFYGKVPRTAREMYEHTKNVNAYYFGEIGIDADNDGTIYDCRQRGFALLEQIPGFLDIPAAEGSYGELWSLRKVLRRFVWHDRIHAKAMYRMALKTFPELKSSDRLKAVHLSFESHH